ncbi:MAG: hypothetical protein WCG91_04240 [Candidatus Shapirobacteria bacterium]
MKYLFTVILIALTWIIMIIIMPIVQKDHHIILYFLAIVNTFVLYLIGFRSS